MRHQGVRSENLLPLIVPNNISSESFTVTTKSYSLYVASTPDDSFVNKTGSDV